MSEDLLRKHIAAVLQAEEDYEKRKEQILTDYETKGHRIVDGGQTGPDTWEVTDYRTGELIVEGAGGLAGYDEATSSEQAEREKWVHIDPITEHLAEDDDPITEGLPESLCQALAEWVRDQAAPEDIDELMGERR